MNKLKVGDKVKCTAYGEIFSIDPSKVIIKFEDHLVSYPTKYFKFEVIKNKKEKKCL